MLGTGTFNIIKKCSQIILETSDFGNFSRDKNVFAFRYRDEKISFTLDGTDNLSFDLIPIANFSFEGVAVISYADFKTKLETAFPNEGGGSSYALPTMSATVKGGAQLGTGLEVVNGFLNSLGGGGAAIPYDYINVKDAPFNAIGDGSNHPLSEYFLTLPDAQIVYPRATSLDQKTDGFKIQKAIDYAVLNDKNVYIPAGIYQCSNSLVLINGGSENPGNGFVSTKITGSSTWFPAGIKTQLVFDFKNAPGLIIQRGKGCEIKELIFSGAFVPPPSGFTDRATFFNKTLLNFVTDGSGDESHSPHCAIAIDPFTAVGFPINSYPSLQQFYNLGGGTSNGSSAIFISTCVIIGWVLGVGSSVNGQLKNAELIKIEKIFFENCKHCIVGACDQEKVNIIDYCAAWGGCYSFFTNTGYGSSYVPAGVTAGNWYISNINTAGSMVEFCNIIMNGWFPVFLKNLYCESIGRIGTYNVPGGEMNNCLFDFEYPFGGGGLGDNDGAGILDLLNCTAGTFTCCTFRLYGQPYLMLLMANIGGCTFRDCNFENIIYYEDTLLKPVFERCFNPVKKLVKQKGHGGAGAQLKIPRGDTGLTLSNEFYYGDNNSIERVTELGDQPPYIQYGLNGSAGSIVVLNKSFTFTAIFPTDYEVNAFCKIEGSFGIGYGYITAIAGDQVTVSHCSANVVNNAVTYVYAFYPNLFVGSFMGNFYNENTISDMVLDWGLSLADFVGKYFRHPKFYNGTSYFKIISYDAALNRFTLATGNGQVVTAVGTALLFSNGIRKTVESVFNQQAGALNNAFILQKNSLYYMAKNTDDERVFKVTLNGLSKVTNPETRLATLIEQ